MVMGMHNTKIIARPWQPQDLIDDLQGIIDEECDNYLNTRRTTLCMARDYLKEHFAEQKWIPVTERLPDAWVDVLSCDRNKNLTVDCVDEKGKWYSEYKDLEEVTHWMPLPEPPKGE